MVYLISWRKIGVRWRQWWSWLPLETGLNCWEWTGGRHCLTWPTLSEDWPWKQDNLLSQREKNFLASRQSWKTNRMRFHISYETQNRGRCCPTWLRIDLKQDCSKQEILLRWLIKSVGTNELEKGLRLVQVRGDFLKVNNSQRHQQSVQWILTNFSAELVILLF